VGIEIDPEELKALRGQAKRQLRRRLRSVRLAVPAAARAERSRAIVERVTACDAFIEARSIGLFFPMRDKGEVDLRALDAAARAVNKIVYYPFMQPRGETVLTGFRRADALDDLAERGRGFAEPPIDAPRAERGDIDLIVVPALGVTEGGQRLGYGAGFYDATLPDFRPPARALAVAFDFELLAELPASEHDVTCDLVVTDRRTILAGTTRDASP
jgi:5-formyltetrahydrofolate cyclo-ligase